jgi:hypothetical protein
MSIYMYHIALYTYFCTHDFLLKKQSGKNKRNGQSQKKEDEKVA